MLRNWFAHATHCHVQGTSQSGKSKFIEHCIREHIRRGDGVCLIDWHGTLYEDVLRYAAYYRPRQPIVIVNPSASDFITPFNPFALPPHREPSAHVNRLASILVKPWGEADTNRLPTYERIVKMMLSFMAVTGEPLHHAAKLLEYPKRELREWAINAMQGIPDHLLTEWKTLQYVHSLKDWEAKVLSTQNRLGRFLSSRAILRFMGLPTPSISIPDCIRQKSIVLVNLKESDALDPESGKTFAALLLSQFLNAAFMNMGRPIPYFLYLDECQNYLTDDAARMLDQVLKSGLRMTLVHHDMGQFYGNIPLQSSLQMNARLNVIFGGSALHDAKSMAEELFLAESNTRWCKETRYRYVTEYEEESYSTTSDSSGATTSEGHVGEADSASHGESFSSTTSYSTRLVPRQRKERDGQEDYSREEKIAMLAQRILSLTTGECYVKTPHTAFRYRVPLVRPYLPHPVHFLEFKETLHSHTIPAHEADELLREAEARFLRKGHDYASTGKSRPTKKRALSPQQ